MEKFSQVFGSKNYYSILCKSVVVNKRKTALHYEKNLPKLFASFDDFRECGHTKMKPG